MDKVLSHVVVVLSLMFLVFLVLDQFNPLMNFVSNDISSWLLGILCAAGIARSMISWSKKKQN